MSINTNYLQKLSKNKLLYQLLLYEKCLKNETEEHNKKLFKKWIGEIHTELQRREQERLTKLSRK